MYNLALKYTPTHQPTHTHAHIHALTLQHVINNVAEAHCLLFNLGELIAERFGYKGLRQLRTYTKLKDRQCETC